MKLPGKLICLLCFLCVNTASAATQAVLRLVQQKNAAPLQVGSVIDLEIILEGTDAPANWLIDSENNSRWLNQGPVLVDIRSLEALSPTRLHLQAVITKSGRGMINPLVLRQENSQIKTSTNSISLEVGSTLNQEDKQPIWLLPPILIGGWNVWVIYGVLGALLLIMLACLWYIVVRIRRRKSAPLTPAESAFVEIKKLEALLQGKLELSADDCKAFAFRLSALLRKYCSEIYLSNCLDSTDKEFLDRLQHFMISQQLYQEMQEILNAISEVRYSTKLLTTEPARRVLEKGNHFISALQATRGVDV